MAIPTGNQAIGPTRSMFMRRTTFTLIPTARKLGLEFLWIREAEIDLVWSHPPDLLGSISSASFKLIFTELSQVPGSESEGKPAATDRFLFLRGQLLEGGAP